MTLLCPDCGMSAKWLGHACSYCECGAAKNVNASRCKRCYLASPTIKGPHRRMSSQREIEMVMLYTGGCTLEEIGKAVGLTRERVRQICTRNGVTKATLDRKGWERVSLSEPLPARLKTLTGIREEELAEYNWRREQAIAKRERIAVWVLKDLLADLLRRPMVEDLAKALSGRDDFPKGSRTGLVLNFVMSGSNYSAAFRTTSMAVIARIYSKAGISRYQERGKYRRLTLNPDTGTVES